MTKDDNWASPGKPVKRFFKSAKWEDRFLGWSEHPDGRFPLYPVKLLRQRAQDEGFTLRLIRKPTKEDWEG